jgi:hypothetical protein
MSVSSCQLQSEETHLITRFDTEEIKVEIVVSGYFYRQPVEGETERLVTLGSFDVVYREPVLSNEWY